MIGVMDGVYDDDNDQPPIIGVTFRGNRCSAEKRK